MVMKVNNKVLVKIYIPVMEMQFDVWLPISRNVSKIIVLLVKAINEFSGGVYKPTNMPTLYEKNTAKEYNINASVKDNNIKNGTEIVLI